MIAFDVYNTHTYTFRVFFCIAACPCDVLCWIFTNRTGHKHVCWRHRYISLEISYIDWFGFQGSVGSFCVTHLRDVILCSFDFISFANCDTMRHANSESPNWNLLCSCKWQWYVSYVIIYELWIACRWSLFRCLAIDFLFFLHLLAHFDIARSYFISLFIESRSYSSVLEQ